MKGIFVSDLHLRLHELHGVPEDNFNSRTNDKLEYIYQIVSEALGSKVDMVVFGGDTFDKINPPEKLRLAFMAAIAPLVRNNIPTFILMGNHDTDGQYANLSSEMEVVSQHHGNNFYLITRPQGYTVKGYPFYFVPWSGNDEEIAKACAHVNPQIVFGHFGVKGATASGTEFILSEGIEETQMKGNIYTFLGHYHRHQCTDTYCYVGSLARTDMSEANITTGFIRFTVTSSLLEWDFVDIHDRKFFNLKFTEPEPIVLPMEFKDAVIKLTCEGSDAWMTKNKILFLPKLLRDAGAHKVSHQFIRTKEIVSAATEYVATHTYTQMVSDYAETKKRPELKELGKTILNTANEARKAQVS